MSRALHNGRIHGLRPIAVVLAEALDWHPLAAPAAARRFEGLRLALADHGFTLALVSCGNAPPYFTVRRGGVVHHLATLADVVAFSLQVHGLHLTPGATNSTPPAPYLVTLQPVRHTA